MIRAPKGMLLANFDLSQAESWVVAFAAGEERMKYALMFGDIHAQTAGSALFYGDVGCEHDWKKCIGNSKEFNCIICQRIITEIMRYSGKRTNHANSYGQGPFMLATAVNKESDQPPYLTISIAQAKTYNAAWHAYYTGIAQWWKRIQYQLGVDRTLITPYGFSRTFFGQWGDEMFKEAYAFYPQSTVADHFNGAIQPELGIPGGLIEVRNRIRAKSLPARILNQSHDSCLILFKEECKDELLPLVHGTLLRPMVVEGETFTIPVDCEIGERWGELEKVKIAA